MGGVNLKLVVGSSLPVDGSQFLSCRTGHGRLFDRFRSRPGIECVKNGRADKDGEKERYDIHACTKEEGLPTADRVEDSTFHWILD